MGENGIRQTETEGRTKEIQDNQKAKEKMLAVTPSIPIIALNVNGVNA